MPTQSDPNSPYVDTQLQAALGGRPPGTPTTAGKPVAQAANVSFPAPPAVSAKPNGRPPKPTMPTPGMPSASAPVAATPSAAGPGQAPPGEQMSGIATEEAGPAAPQQPAVDTQRYREAVVQLRKSLGPLPRVWRHPSLPEFPVEVGKPNWNPATGMWSS